MSVSRRYKPIKADPAFHKMLMEIRLNRIKNGKDSLMQSIPRLTKAISRVPNIRQTLESAEFVEDNK